MLFEDCTICLDEMHPTDYDHPLQCERRCGYNFCKNCIESLITSSKDDYMEASDGNRHVKIFLLCPNCRSDLSHTIRDTLLLRKADAVLSARGRESELTPSQLKLKGAMEKPEVLEAIQTALKLESEYLGKELEERLQNSSLGELNYNASNGSKDSTECSTANTIDEDEEYEEEGVEADLNEGVHLSFRSPPPPKEKPIVKNKIDPTLFAGLDYFLSEEERSYVTDFMTSGEPRQLAEAAQILYSVGQISKDPDNHKLTLNKTKKKNPKSFGRRSSVFELIAEANEAHSTTVKEEKKVERELNAYLKIAETKARAHKQLDRDLVKQARFQKLFPIPVRMPKAIELDLNQVFDLDFIDDTWNGTVMDAYSKISIGYTGTVTQKRTFNRGVQTVLGGIGGDEGDVRIALEGQKRVLVVRAGRDSGQQGAVKGDVVTYIAGEEVAGKMAAELFILINTARQMGQNKIMITLNAERSVAEALKRRAMAIAESY